MEWLCVLAVFVLVIVSVKYVLYRRQIKDICRQMEFLLKENTNKRIQTDLRSKEILKLADKVNAMADRHEKERISIRKKERQLKEALTNISHDIRTPLTSLKGFFELYTQERDEGKKEYYRRVIWERTEELTLMLEELFTYTKLQNETYELLLEQQDFTKLVLDSLFSFYEQWKEEGVSPKLRVEESPAMILCNDIAVKRILANVLRNAMVHGDGTIEIVYRVLPRGILFQCYNGCMEGEEVEVERVFERFYKGDSARRETSSGLGLSIARELARRMDGKMEAKMEKGRFLVEIGFDFEKRTGV